MAKSGLKVKYHLIWVCLGAYGTLILNPILPFNFRSRLKNKARLKYPAMGGVAGLSLPGRPVLAPSGSGSNPQNERPGLCSKPPCLA